MTDDSQFRNEPITINQPITAEELRNTIVSLNHIVYQVGKGGAWRGLNVVAAAFGALLTTYAKPNLENPLGMCDDSQEFRKYFADIVAKGELPNDRTE